MNNNINEYLTANGQSPYAIWLKSLEDLKGRAIVITHVDRMELGHFGNYEPVGNGVYELRIHYGPGYRVYYARRG